MNFIYVRFPVLRGLHCREIDGLRGGVTGRGVAQPMTVGGINLRGFSRKVQQFVGTVYVQPNLRKQMVLVM